MSDDEIQFQDQSPTYKSDAWKVPDRSELEDSGVMLAEESPLAHVDDHAPDPDGNESGLGIVLEDRAADYDPTDDPEPPRPEPKPAPTPEQQLARELASGSGSARAARLAAASSKSKRARSTPSNPSTLPERRVAVPPKQEQPRPGVAVCPECQAKNAYQARICARCKAEIPAPDAPAAARRNHNGILKGAFEPKQRGPVDAELIPEHVRAQWDVQKQEQAERLEGRQKHRKQVAKELAIASAVGFVIASFVLSAGLPGWMRFFAILIDGALGVGAAYAVFHTGASRLPAAGIFGGVGFVTHTAKLGLVMGMAGPYVGVAFFLMWIGIIGLTTFLGFGAGMSLELRRWDQEI